MKHLTVLLLFFPLFTACTRSSSTAPLITPRPFTPLASLISPTLPPLSPENSPTPPPPTEIPAPLPTSPASPTPQPTKTPSAPSLLTFLFTGQIFPTPCPLPQNFFAGVTEYLQPAHLTLGMMPETGCPTDAGVLAEAGFDAMRLRADCTTEACDPKMLSEVEAAFQQNGMIPIRMANEGEPGVIEVQGVRFGFVAVEGEEMDEDNLRAGIANARGVAEVVIVLPAWGAGTDPFPDPDQLALAQVAADAGADLIIGSHTQIQAFGEVEGVPVFFGLGNFTGAEAERGLMVRVYFRGGEYLGFELFPTFTDAEGVHLTGPEETAEILEGLEEINPGLP